LPSDGSDDVTSATNDQFGAFMPDGRFDVAPTATGPLSGKTFAVKDLIDVRGHVTSAGNPTWARESGVAAAHAAVVAALLDAGAMLAGKTVLDEMAFGVAGINAHYGTPVNPAAPGRLAGGSSCGSAAAVAGALCDFALGTDTGGSVRIPASCCGLFGIRPSHGRISTEGVVPLAPSFDTVGWLARDAETFGSVGDVLLPPDVDRSASIERVIVATDVLDALDRVARRSFDARRGRLETWLGPTDEIGLAGPAKDLAALQGAYRAAQGREATLVRQPWIDAHPGALGPMAEERYRIAATTTEIEAAEAQVLLEAYAAWLAGVVGDAAVICLPTTPGPAPRADGDPATLAADRLATLALTAAASGAGMPQVTIPHGATSGSPLGLSFIGALGTDRELVAFAIRASTLIEA
jgi:amidase